MAAATGGQRRSEAVDEVALSLDDELAALIYDGKSVVSLQNAARARHLRALGIGEVALLFVAGGAALLAVVLEEFPDLSDL